MTSASEVYIQATDTDPAVRAQDRIHRIHQRLRDELAGLAGAEEVERAALAAFCTGELRRYLTAADETLYAAASGAAETRLLVRGLRAASSALDRRVDALAEPAEPAGQGEQGKQAAPGDASTARAIEAVLADHLTVERTVLLPALADLPGADLPTLVEDLETLLDGGRLEQPPVIDVREIPHGKRHPRIFARYARLAPGEAFTLVNNHDPKPLRREFEATHPGAFTWDYVESGPEQWQVRIGRVAADA